MEHPNKIRFDWDGLSTEFQKSDQLRARKYLVTGFQARLADVLRPFPMATNGLGSRIKRSLKVRANELHAVGSGTGRNRTLRSVKTDALRSLKEFALGRIVLRITECGHFFSEDYPVYTAVKIP
ncbi:MAG: hypothetical protein OXC63_12720 [Aestuariivita sp.]|nr:hypothetical protein [Aestuariivita sp.]MCY4346667.1 hypothetical protein [Aestuariivita sp.]